MAPLAPSPAIPFWQRCIALCVLLCLLPLFATAQFSIMPGTTDLQVATGPTTATVTLSIQNLAAVEKFAVIQPGVYYIAPEPALIAPAETILFELALDTSLLGPGYYADTVIIREETPAKQLPAPQYFINISIEIYAEGPPEVRNFFQEVSVVEEIPGGFRVNEGDYVGLGIDATGSRPIDFLWQYSANRDGWSVVEAGADVSAIDEPYLDFPAIAASRTGWYRCTLSNDRGTTTTPELLIDVIPSSPTITGPTAASVYEGDTAVFFVTVESTTTVDYQWEVAIGENGFRALSDQEDGVLGSSTNNLIIPAASDARIGLYRCVVTNGAGTFESEAAPLSVLPLPPDLELTPAAIVHYVVAGAPSPSAALALRNTGAGVLNFSIGEASDEPWLGTLNPASGSILPGQVQTVEIAIAGSALDQGEYLTDLNLTTNVPGQDAVTIPFTLIVVDEFTVTSLADAGPGTLRDLITITNETPDPQTIRFAVTGSIVLQSQLPAINDPTGGTTILAEDAVFLDGANLRGPENGLVIESADNVIDGLGIIRFPANGILVTGENALRNRIIRCRIGTDGSQDRGNLQSGIRLDGGSQATTIGGENDLANTISGNSFSAVSIGASSQNIIRGNNLGTGTGGAGAIGNGGHGFHILPALSSNNTIGGTILFEANTIAANKFQGGSLDVLVGRTVRLRALVHGNDAYQYQWYNERGIVAGGGQRELVLANIQKSAEGSYYCVISNAAGDSESKRTFVNVIDRKELAALSLLPAYAGLDLNGDGVLSRDELRPLLAKILGATDKGIADLTDEEFDALDSDGDGFLTYQELLAGSGIAIEEIRYEVSPTLYIYPPADIDEGPAGERTFIISNLELDALEVLTTPTITGPASAEFAVTGGEGENELALFGERTIVVGSDPDLLNERVAYLTIQTDDFLLPVYHVLLSGYGFQTTGELLESLLGTSTIPRQRDELDVNADRQFDASDIQLNTNNGL